jgi:glycosyltransferase involved in cell wall biosynthesis
MKNTKPLFSVLIASYNYGRFLKAAVTSVIGQTLSDFEIVIVDDGSTDHTTEVIRQLLGTDSRVRAFRQVNSGQASAFNRAFAESRGQFICFLDADDLWMPDKLEWMKRIAAEARNTALFQHNMYVLRHCKTKDLIYRPTLTSGVVVDEIATLQRLDFFVPTSGLAVPRKILAKIMPMPSQFRICADAYITRAVLAHGKLFSLDLPLGYYRIHGNNFWVDNPNRPDSDMVQNSIVPAVLEYYRQSGIKNVASTPTYGASSSHEAIMMAHLTLDRVRQLKKLYRRIAVYGAGAHTRWLMDLLAKTGVYPKQMPDVACILDDHAEKCSPIQGIPVESTRRLNPETFDAIILSSDCYQFDMKNNLADHFLNRSVPIVNLYEGLPPGPYAKIQTDKFMAMRRESGTISAIRNNSIAMQILLERLKTIRENHPRVALYGPAKHIERLAYLIHHVRQTTPNNAPAVTAVMTDKADGVDEMANATVKSPHQFSSHEYDAIITVHPDMHERLYCLFFPSPPPIINLYEGLPASPFMNY